MDYDSRNMLISSDYPMDKIVFSASGSFSVPAGSSTANATINHGLGFPPLMVGLWSPTSDFSEAYEFGTGEYTSPTTPLSKYGYCYSTSSQVVVRGGSNAGAYTFYYKIFGYEPSNSGAVVPFTQSQGDNYIVNTDYNYLKLIDTGYMQFTYSASQQTYDINHGLPYSVTVLAWTAYPPLFQVTRLNQAFIYSPSILSGVYFQILPGVVRIVVDNIPSSPVDVYWRIYIDEQA